LAQETNQTEAAWQSWNEGKIADAHAAALSVLSNASDNDRARHLIVLTSFVTGDYEGSIAHYLLLSPEYEGYDSLTRIVVDAYLHLERLAEAASFAERMGRPDAECAWLRRRADRPMTVTLDTTTVIPFVRGDMLADLMPAIPIEINGRAYTGRLDTGGSYISTSPKMVGDLGIEVSQIGTGVANNQATTISAGLVDSLKLGDALLTNVPVASLDALAGPAERMIILGTRILSRFIVTWDNGEGRLVLTPRGDDAARGKHLQAFSEGAEVVNFYLAGDHYMWAQGAVGSHKALFFVDTGLLILDGKGRQPAIGVSPQTIERWGLSAGGSRFIDSPGPIRLGTVSRSGCSMHVFGDQRNLPSFGGLQPTAIISHGFLKDFVWTIDFDHHQYFLTEIAKQDRGAP
jgi:hypothetical protein